MLSVGEISKIENVLKVCINLSDFNKRLKINTKEFSDIYDELVLHHSNISSQSRQNLITINNDKIIESNYKYMVGLQYRDIKNFGYTEVEEDILLLQCRKLKSFSDYDISDFEICQRAKDCGVTVISSESIIKDLMLKYINSLLIFSCTRDRIINILRDNPLFDDLNDVEIIDLVVESGIQII